MIRILGDTSVALAFVLSLAGAYAMAFGLRRGRPELVRVGERVAYANFALLSVATFGMVLALATLDFSISYVAQVGSRSTPLFFRIISLWGALEGSILFWGWVLAGYTALAVWRAPKSLGAMVPYATAVLLGIGAFFYLLLIGPASPFGEVSPVPADGPGPNPLLQNHILMAVHPPLLYFGYVGLSVPFAFAMGSLLARRRDDEWIDLTRRWTLIAWMFLSLAIVAGMWWSYEVLGWGGYWAWDPVENASFMPWLTATAFLHSVMVQERRGMLKVWNLNLVISTFLLTVLGTFLTRSGILSSVHAFSEGPIGAYFLGFIALALIFSLSVLAGRSTELRTEGRLDSAVSRETVFLFNNLLLSAFTFTVLLGTLFPLVAEAVRGVQVSVGAPFFNQVTLPLCVALLFLVGVGPVLPWGAPRFDSLRSRFAAPLIGLVVGAIVALVAGVPSVYTLLAFSFAGFALTTNVQEITRPALVRVRAHGENFVVALARVIRANRHRYGGYIAHIGIIVLAVGVAASSSYRVEREATLRPGETLQVEGYDLRLERVWAQEQPHRFSVGVDVALLGDGGERVAVLDPKLNFYFTRNEPIPTPAVRSRMTDLYINLMAFERDGSTATISVLVEPLVIWIWVGGLIVALGALIAAWPGGRRRKGVPRISPASSETLAEEPRGSRPELAGVGG